jgi:hypothetical protein
MHVIERSDLDGVVFQKDKPRPRLISGPARGVSEIKTAMTWLIQDAVKKTFPELALGLGLDGIAQRFRQDYPYSLSLDGSQFDST